MAHGWELLTAADRATILEGIRRARPQGGPYHLELDWSDRCNVHCFFCNNEIRNRSGQTLPVELVRRALDEAVSQGLKSLRLSGGGEPLFHPQIRPLLDLIEERGLVIVNLTTNGVLIDEDIAGRLVRMRCRDIVVSLNYPDPHSYAAAMGTAARNWERVCQGLDYLRRERERAGPGAPPRVILQFFLSNRTKFDIPRMVEVGLAHGADLIMLGALDNVDPSERIPEADRPRVAEDLRHAVRANPGRIEAHVALEGLDEAWVESMREMRAERGESAGPSCMPPPGVHAYCYIGYYSMAIRGGGEVFPCCMIMLDPGAAPLGSLHRQGLLDIWRGPEYQAFRREMERVELLGPDLNFARQGFRHIYPVCAQHCGCALSCTLCDDDFLRQAEMVHQAKRRSPRGRLLRVWRWGRTGR